MDNPLEKYHFRDEDGNPLELCVEYQRLLADIDAIGNALLEITCLTLAESHRGRAIAKETLHKVIRNESN